jgi:hypothetical protein
VDAGGKRSHFVFPAFIQCMGRDAGGKRSHFVSPAFIQSVPDPRTRGSVIQESASGIVGGFGSSLRMI